MKLPFALDLPSAHLGVLLRAFREYYFGLTATRASLLCAKDSILALVAALRPHGCAISTATYEKLEAGDYRPEAAAPLIEAFAAALSLTMNERNVLQAQLVYDVLRPELGDESARFCLRHVLPDTSSTA